MLQILEHFIPAAIFILILIVIFNLFSKPEIFGKNSLIYLIISFVFAIIFFTSTFLVNYLKTIIPIFTIIVVVFTFLLALLLFTGKIPDNFIKNLTVFTFFIMLFIFLIAILSVSKTDVTKFLPEKASQNPTILKNFLLWIYSKNVSNAILLIISVSAVSYVLLKT